MPRVCVAVADPEKKKRKEGTRGCEMPELGLQGLKPRFTRFQRTDLVQGRVLPGERVDLLEDEHDQERTRLQVTLVLFGVAQHRDVGRLDTAPVMHGLAP